MNPGIASNQSIQHLSGTYICSIALGAKRNAKGVLQVTMKMSVYAISLDPDVRTCRRISLKSLCQRDFSKQPP